jgi:xanthine dehydrogenase small subunit
LLPRAADALAEDYAPISDLRASAAYRGQAARGLLERYLSAMAGQPVPVLYPAATPPVNTHA